ncbi:MAG TPA: NAD(P) transhydrogenase subunit alpha [Pyrinomonadaceae bacterium]|jgi:NAD(P) transhydrogenase subunit alpha
MIFMILFSSETSSSFTVETLMPALYVFALAAFLGYQVISRVPPLLHTPLMSATNAISGISLVGSIVTAGAKYNMVSTILGFTAVTCATINVVGGFMITDRMLRMFKRKPTAKETKELAAKETRQIASGNGDGTKQ